MLPPTITTISKLAVAMKIVVEASSREGRENVGKLEHLTVGTNRARSMFVVRLMVEQSVAGSIFSRGMLAHTARGDARSSDA